MLITPKDFMIELSDLKNSYCPFLKRLPSLDYLLDDNNYLYVVSLINFAEYFDFTADELIYHLKDRACGAFYYNDHFRPCFWEADMRYFMKNSIVPYFHPFDLFMIKNSQSPYMRSFIGDDDGGDGITADLIFLNNKDNTAMFQYTSNEEKGDLSHKREDYEQKYLLSHKEKYHLYLETDSWKEKRATKLNEAGYKCQLCNSESGLQVHHRTYERVFNEDLADLIVLCRGCHKKFHNIDE
jgi:hypothetical protein